MTIKLYHSEHTRSLRVLWFLEELQNPFELEKVSLALGNTGGKEYAKVNPLQKVPSIEIDGKVMLESTAILQYLADVHGGQAMTLSADHPEYSQYLQWLHGGESGFGLYLSIYFGHTLLLPEKERDPKMAVWAADNLRQLLTQLGEDLQAKEFIVGDKFTIADISVGYVCYGLSLVGQLPELAPENVNAWWAKLSKRDALQRAIAH